MVKRRADDGQIISALLVPEIEEMLGGGRRNDARSALEELLAPEVADLMMGLSKEERAEIFDLLSIERAADVFSFFAHDEQERLLEELGREKLGAVLDEMDADDRVEFLEDADESLVENLMRLLGPGEREATEKILEYPEESVGRLVTPDYVKVHGEWTVERAIGHIREYGKEAETVLTLYMVDEGGVLIDYVQLERMVLAEPGVKCGELAEGHVVRLKVDDDREEAVRVMEKYDLPVLPVVDEGGELVGIVTFDDVADVQAEEATEDIQKMGGMEALDEPYLSVSLFELFRKRVVWLIVLLVGGMLTIPLLAKYGEELGALPMLAFFIPLIIASGGNSGSQAAALIIRAMAVGEVGLRDWWRVMHREIMSGMLLGATIGGLGLARVVLWGLFGWNDYMGHEVLVGLTVGVSLASVVLIGTLVGSMLPLFLKRVGLDPATSSTPFVATIVDVAGLLIYFGLATMLLGGMIG